jgi:hypothetical protein
MEAIALRLRPQRLKSVSRDIAMQQSDLRWQLGAHEGPRPRAVEPQFIPMQPDAQPDPVAHRRYLAELQTIFTELTRVMMYAQEETIILTYIAHRIRANKLFQTPSMQEAMTEKRIDDISMALWQYREDLAKTLDLLTPRDAGHVQYFRQNLPPLVYNEEGMHLTHFSKASWQPAFMTDKMKNNNEIPTLLALLLHDICRNWMPAIDEIKAWETEKATSKEEPHDFPLLFRRNPNNSMINPECAFNQCYFRDDSTVVFPARRATETIYTDTDLCYPRLPDDWLVPIAILPIENCEPTPLAVRRRSEEGQDPQYFAPKGTTTSHDSTLGKRKSQPNVSQTSFDVPPPPKTVRVVLVDPPPQVAQPEEIQDDFDDDLNDPEIDNIFHAVDSVSGESEEPESDIPEEMEGVSDDESPPPDLTFQREI